MIIGFDGTLLHGPKTGIGYYTQFLIRHLRQQANLEILTYDGLRVRPATEVGNDTKLGGTDLGTVSLKAKAVLKNAALARKLWRGLKAAGFRRSAEKFDLFHATNYLPPIKTSTLVLPLVHDVSHIRHPEWHPAERVRYLEARSREIEGAPAINTVSRFSAREIQETLGIAAERIHVTYPGINPYYTFPYCKETKHLEGLDLKAGEFFLCVGTLEPRKNLGTVIEAYSGLRSSVQKRFPLVIVGPPGWGNLQLPPSIHTLKRCGLVRFMGYLDEPTMRALYRDCAAFFFPSSYEGFGMPVSEAMACGSRPVVTTGGAPEEVAGELGVSLAPFDPGAWSEAMLRAVDEGWHENQTLRRRLRERSKRFSWSANAEATAQIYRVLYDEVL